MRRNPWAPAPMNESGCTGESVFLARSSVKNKPPSGTCYGAEARGAVERARRRHVERPGAGPVGETADREIRGLHAETNRVNETADVAQSVEKKERAAAGVEIEPRVVGRRR